MIPTFAHPLLLAPAGLLALAALALGFWAQARPGQGVRVVGQRPALQGAGMALVLAGLGLGLAEPHWGRPEVSRLTVHVLVDTSRSMLVQDAGGQSRWAAASTLLDRLWARPGRDVQFSLDLLSGDMVPLMPPGDDRDLLRDALKAVRPGEIGSPGTSFGHGIPQVVATVEKGAPAILLLLSDGEETLEAPDQALARALPFLREAHLPLYAVAFGGSTPGPVPGADGRQEPSTSAAHPDFLKALAESSGGRLLAPGEDLAGLFQRLADGEAPLPVARTAQPAHPELGAWLALLGLTLWLLATGKPLRAWRLALGGVLALGWTAHGQAALPVPQSVQAWISQTALDQGNLEVARRWIPRGDTPLHRLLAAEIQLKSRDYPAALAVLAPLAGQGAPRPLPPWRAPALLLAARAAMAMDRTEEAQEYLRRLLREDPGRAEAVHDLQSLLRDTPPPPPAPKKPPPPPPIRPAMGARQDELEGFQQRMPQKKPPPKGVKDI